ncbi:S24 family peptidase [Undibacterium sp. JH2W]|uniref:S24 family peptidase n=1 Tax=Undibacterium sp. JH2W TaxID=3413037 RepID=UPI003BF1B291
MMDESSIPWTRIEALLSARDKDAAWLMAELGVTKQRFSNWKSRGLPKRNVPLLATALEVSSDVLFAIQPSPPAGYLLQSAEQAGIETARISHWNVRAACGAGIMNYEPASKGYLVKEASFFKKYGLKPEAAFAIHADGNSMANFIVDGDIVIFDTSKTRPVNDRIFAIEHPDGLRIKRLRRQPGGAWILESDNPDKQRYPDEEIHAELAASMKIYGQFVYRQGG